MHADVVCPPGGASPSLCPDKDFMTGGGFVIVNRNKGHFAIAAGLRSNADDWGHTHYRDNALVVDATSIGGYGSNSDGSHFWSGLANVNGAPGHTYQVTALDKAEPGGGSDHFTLPVDGVQRADGNLADGNIQLHCK